MAVNEVTSVDVQTLTPFKRFIMTLGELPTSYLESMTYAELVMWFCNFLQEKVIPAVNNNADALQDVITYLENLNFQDEVDHKLDEMAESGELQEIVADYLNSKAIFAFDNVESMKESTNLIDGSYAKTLGYYEKNDGGKALYKIRKITNVDTIDNCSIIPIGDDDLIAELIPDNTINTMVFGIDNTGVTDIVDSMNNLIDYCLDKNITHIEFKKGTYLVSNLIFIPYQISIDGNDSTIKVQTNSYAFGLNTKNGNTWETAYPNYPKNIFKNFYIENADETTYTTAKGISLCSGSIIENIKFKKLYESISSPNLYIDNRTIKNILCENRIGDSNDIKLFLGDGLELNNICGALIKLTDVAGGLIMNNIGCNYYIEDCRALSVINDHNEHDETIIINSSYVNFENCFYWKRNNVRFNIDSKNTLITSSVTLKNITFNIINNNILASVVNDITTSWITDLKLTNVRETFSASSGHASIGNSILINDVEIPALYTNELIYKGKIPVNTVTTTSNLKDYNGLFNTIVGANDENSTYQNNTYYFKVMLFIDPVRQIRRTSEHSYAFNEKSITVGSNKQKLTFINNYLQQINDGCIRIYRGTTTNSYDSYVDIPVSGNYLDKIQFDYGTSINGRYMWQSRTAGAMDNTIATGYYELLPNGNVKITATSAPSYGTWKKGDIIINSNPTSDGANGWLCITDGTPGTWKQL